MCLDNEDGSALEEAAPHDWPRDKWPARPHQIIRQQFILSCVFETLILDIEREETMKFSEGEIILDI